MSRRSRVGNGLLLKVLEKRATMAAIEMPIIEEKKSEVKMEYKTFDAKAKKSK